MTGPWFLCSIFEQLTVGHRRQFVQPLLSAFIVVEMDVIFYCRGKAIIILEFSKIVHLAFQDSPEALHRAIVDTVPSAGHTLLHTGLVQLRLEYLVGILKSPVAVKQRVNVGIFRYCQIKCFYP